jgi:diguanylate cyclase (GGDEF)-like protein
VLVLVACAAMITLFTVFGPASVTHPAQPVAVPSVIGLLLAAAVFGLVPPARLDAVGAFLVLAVSGVALLGVLVVTTGTPPTGAQALLAFAVLYAGFHLRQAAVAVVTAAALAADAVMLFLLVPTDAAVTQLAFFGTMYVVMAMLFVRSGNTQEAMVAALSRQAGVDALTGLVTRRVLDEAVAAALSSGAKDQGSALMVMDVDNFKSINDGHGHPVGDDSLVHLARVISGSVRTGDAVIGRLGGDEIAVLLPGCLPEVAVRRAEELLAAVRAAPLRMSDGTLLALSVSIGVAHAPRDAGELRSLYSAADAALYEAKRDGRGRVAVAGGGIQAVHAAHGARP